MIAETPLAYLRTIAQLFYTYSVPDARAERHWRQCRLCACCVDALIDEPLLAIHRNECPVGQLSALVTDLEAAQQTAKEQDEVSRVEPSSTLPSTGSTATSNEATPSLARMRELAKPSVDALFTLFSLAEHDAGWRHEVTEMLASYGEMLFQQFRAGEAVASRPAAQETSELDRQIGDYKQRVDAHDTISASDAIWLLNELIYERDQRAAPPAVEGARPQEEKDDHARVDRQPESNVALPRRPNGR